DLRRAGARGLRAAVLAVHQARHVVVAVRPRRAVVSRDAAVAAATADGDRHDRALPVARPLAGRRRAPAAVADRRGRQSVMSPEIQLAVVTVLFLSLLMAGMAVPFAIVIPAILYLLLQGGPAALNSLGLVTWGSMNSFVLTTVPLFMLMAEILSASGLSSRIYRGLEKLVAKLPGGLL